MPYLTAADLVSRFGEEEVAQVADRGTPRVVTAELLALAIADDPLAGWAAADVAAVNAALAVIDTALADAQSAVDGYLSTRYATPLASVPPVVARLVADLARAYLHGDRASEPMAKARDAALALCRDIAAGKVAFGNELQSPKTGDGAVVVSTPTRFWSREQRGL